jgi:hypothetical protein
MSITLEYVTSGTNHISAANKYIHDNQFALDFTRSVFNKLNTTNNTKFSLLFNAFQEKRYAEPLQNYRGSIHRIHSDSGGLQIVTVGKKMTPEMYQDIYRLQARYSDIAMSFDEIPVMKLNDKSPIHDYKSRKFDIENYKEFAKLSGRNLREQIELFKEEKTSCKPLLIAHGNCLETYKIWIDIILKEIPSSDHDLIGGISVSGASLGRGFLEDIQKAAYITEFPMNHYIHLLGVGSIKRLLPYIVFASNGYYKKDIHISYDSSSHSSGVTNASYFMDDHEGGLGRYMNRQYEIIYDQVDSLFGWKDKGIEIQDFYQTFRKREWGNFQDTDGNYRLDDIHKNVHIVLGFFGGSVYNFTSTIDKCRKSKPFLFETAKKMKLDRDISALYRINSIDDFEYWVKDYGHYVKSKKIEKTQPVSLRRLFA